MAIYKNARIDKQHFLENSNYGLDFYEFVLGDLKMVDSGRCENVCNPFYDDSKPSFSIFLKNEEMWKYKDYGDPSYYGDVFSFAALHYDMDVKRDFGKLLRNMYSDLGITMLQEEVEVDDSVFDSGYLLPGVAFNDPEGRNKAHDYFKQFGITKEVLRKYHVRAVPYYYFIDKEGELQQWRFKKDELGIIYEDISHIKIYRPGANEFKFQYRGYKPPDFVFGQAAIIRDMLRTKHWIRDILVITGGEKDVMTLAALGYDAICLNSETASVIPEQLEESILLNYKWIVVLYDLDETGKRCAEAMRKRYGFKTCTLPEELKEQGGKDVSDYVKLGLGINYLHQLIMEAAAKEVFALGVTGRIFGSFKISQGFISSKKEWINPPEGSEQTNTVNTTVEAIKEKQIIIEPVVAEPEVAYITKRHIDKQEIDNKTITSDIPLANDDIANTGKEEKVVITIPIKPIAAIAIDGNPHLSDVIFPKLPVPLKSICEQFPDKRDRDLVLLSCLGVLSSFFPTVKSVNTGRIIGANLNLFISAPAASGKGVANWAKSLCTGVQRYLRERYQEELSRYKSDFNAYKKASRKDPDLQEPQEPLRKSLFIPANISVSKMIEMLGANKNFGILFETEGDTLTGALKTEWGDFSDIIRKCFHHEMVSMARRGEDEFIEVENPHLSIVLTGTPAQVNNLISSVENGFFSRFIFYDFKSDLLWKSQFARKDVSLDNFFQMVSEQFYRIWLRHEEAQDTFIDLSEGQIQQIDHYFEDKLQVLSNIHGDDIVANVHRSCIICQRIMMILTALRSLEQNKALPTRLQVGDEDFTIALDITNTLLVHLETIFSRMKRSASGIKLNYQQRKVWEALHMEFTRKEYDTIVTELGIEYKTAEKYIGDFIEKELLVRVKQGQYRKVL